ncbi:MAG TPA: ADP-forming succinate--CoA ligase subunit beta, partial [Candidatus Magasanikbacteria bacterium]|nr:ADP-forming succinate--CoA ligase subunit beta [Candidatus Magasanikbacteria bacterium]
MNLYEFEGKQLFEKHGIKIPRGIVVRREEKAGDVFSELNVSDVVVKAQVLSGKRGKNNGIRFCNKEKGVQHVQDVVDELFAMNVRGQYVAAVRIEEKLDIAEEHYMSITYNTNRKQPMLI